MSLSMAFPENPDWMKWYSAAALHSWMDYRGHFGTILPQAQALVNADKGKYMLKSKGIEQYCTFLPSEIYSLDLQQNNYINFEVSKIPSGNSEVTITVQVQGNGAHQITIRTDNLAVNNPSRKLDLKAGAMKTITWKGRIISPDESWAAVIFPDNATGNRSEVMGSSWEK
jgi:hypothetical protein